MEDTVSILELKVRRGICTRCKCLISTACTGGAYRKHCDGCRIIVKRETRARYAREQRCTPEGKIKHAMYMREYYNTPEGKKAITRGKIAYRQTQEGKTAEARAQTKYHSTPKGKASRALGKARRREYSSNPELYAVRVELLHVLQEPCTKCEIPYKITHQIDHIVALCLGGTDRWSNLQPLCIKCHRKKSVEDVRKLRCKHRDVCVSPDDLVGALKLLHESSRKAQ